MAFFGTTNVDPAADSDGDGQSNAAEYLAGTDPTDANSVLRITGTRISNATRYVRFASLPARIYQLERTNSLTTGVWTSAGAQVTGTGAELEVADPVPVTGDPVFYRITVVGQVGTGLRGEYFYGTDLIAPAKTQFDPSISFDWPSGGPAGMPTSYWSARWSGRLSVPKSDTYTFYLGSDDGSRLYIDGQLIVDSWSGHGYYEQTASVFLDAAVPHTIRVEYFQYGGGAALHLFWSSPTMGKQDIATANLFAEPNYPVKGRRGLEGEYYDLVKAALVLVRLDPTIYFDWGGGSPAPEVPVDYFAVRWRGVVVPEYSEAYTFYTHTDDGCRLWINGQQVIDQWSAPGDSSATVQLVAGQAYAFQLEFQEVAGGAAAQVYWSSPSVPKQVIPSRLLIPPVQTPSNLVATTGSNGDVNLSWNTTATDQTGFRIERSADNLTFSSVGTVAGNVLTYTDTTAAKGTAYFYRVYATGLYGESLAVTSKPVFTPAGNLPGAWQELVLNAQGQIDATAYRNVAASYHTASMIDYRNGPKALDYNVPRVSTTLDQIGVSGWYPQPWDYQNPASTDWFAMSGQLLYSPDAAGDPGVARARNGSIYLTNANPIFDLRIQWTPDPGNYYNANPDPAVAQGGWQAAAGGSLPTPPVTVARSRFMTGLQGALVFQNGLIGISGTGNEPNTLAGRFPSLQLPAGKVPTAACMTLNNEFLLVTVWDTAAVKGQVAVIAIEGTAVATGSNADQHYLYGVPNWPSVRSIKLLGFVDLPFSAPTSIEASADFSQNSGRGQGENANMDLSQQAERDAWYNGSSQYKHVATSGYAVVASRSENKVAFVDLQPLYTYYRNMYFTTAAKYTQTLSMGAAANQWPFTFAAAPEQTPVVTSTLNVPRPTAVAAGFPRGNSFWWRSTSAAYDDGLFSGSAYIGTMAGQVLVYNVGGLNTTAAADAPSLIGAPAVGKNPCHIAYGTQALGANPNDLFVTSRGERNITRVSAAGQVIQTIADSRLVDPVASEISNNFRGSSGASYLSVMDYGAKQAINYISLNGETAFHFGFATVVPGLPFAFRVAEVL